MLKIFLQQNNTKHSLDKTIRTFRYIVLPIYWAILTYMLLKPGTENKEYWFMFSGIDKVLHLAIFSILGFFFKAAFPKTNFQYYILITVLYALLTEMLQEIMHWGRSMEALDLLADTIGLIVGHTIYKYIKKTYF